MDRTHVPSDGSADQDWRCQSPNLIRRSPDGRNEPAAPPHDRGHAGTQPVAGDAALLRARGRQIRPALQPIARPARAGGSPRLSDPPHNDRHLIWRPLLVKKKTKIPHPVLRSRAISKVLELAAHCRLVKARVA